MVHLLGHWVKAYISADYLVNPAVFHYLCKVVFGKSHVVVDYCQMPGRMIDQFAQNVFWASTLKESAY